MAKHGGVDSATGIRFSTTDDKRRRWIRTLGVSCAVAAVMASLAASPMAADAQDDDGPAGGEVAPLSEKVKPETLTNPELTKLTNDLLEVRESAAATEAQLQIGPPEDVLGIRYRNGLPEIEVTFSDLNAEVQEAVAATGFSPTGLFPQFRMMSGPIDPQQLDELAAIPEVVHIRPNYGSTRGVGATTSQADVSIGAATARAQVGVDGTGVEIGVLSDSFNVLSSGTTTGTGCTSTTTGTSSQLSSDLPVSVGNLLPLPVSGTDEGRAMMELIHDLAPGASQTFRTAFVSEADFAAGISELVACGADVIVDDVLYLAEPMFQDGLIAQAADAAAQAGVPYFSSAGNEATYGVDQPYLNSTCVWAAAASCHDFDPGAAVDTLIPVTIPAGATLTMVLQWNQPFVSGGIGPGAGEDLDLLACTDPNCALAYQSTNAQGCAPSTPAGDPMEFLSIPPDPSPRTLYLAVHHFCGSQAGTHFRIATYFNSGGFSWGTTDSGAPVFDQAQIYGHAAAAGAIAVAAVDYREIDTGGGLSGGPEVDVESFSSLGGDLPFYFGPTGDPLPGAPVTRFKPDIAAPDGTNTTFFGGFDTEPDGFPNFYGTSAAAPHAAAVAALMLEAQPTLQPNEVYSRLRGTALDIEGAGVDVLSGSGLVQALEAVAPSLYVSLDCGPVGGASTCTEDVDIVRVNGANLVTVFDGSDVLVSTGPQANRNPQVAQIHGFSILSENEFLISFHRPLHRSMFGFTSGPFLIDDSDVLLFTATSLGENTAGTWSWYFDGSDVELLHFHEDIDAIGLTPTGGLYLSTVNTMSAQGQTFDDSDVFTFEFTGAPGETTTGSFAPFFDGSEVDGTNGSGLARNPEDVNAFSTDPSGNALHLSTIAQLVVTENVQRLVAQDDDIVTCTVDPGPPLACTSWDLQLDGATIGLSAFDVKGLEVHSAVLPKTS